MANAGTATVKFVGDYSQLNAGLASQLAPAKLGKLGKVGGLAAGGAIAASIGAMAAKAAFDLGDQFDKAFDTIRVGTGKTGKQLKGLEKDFKAVYGRVPAGMGEVATAIADVNTRLELTGKPLRQLSTQFVELSRITGDDLQGNIQSVTRLFGDWGVKGRGQVDTLNKLFRASQTTGIAVKELSDYMVQFGSPLRNLGFDFDTAAAMFAKFEKEGVNLQTAMPGLRMALKNFAKDGREPQKALQATFKAIENAGSVAKANTIAFEVFGTRAGPDLAAAVREGRFSFGQIIRDMRDGSDTIGRAARDTNDAGENLKIFWHKVQVAIEPVASAVYQSVTDITAVLAKVDTDTFRDIVDIAAKSVEIAKAFGQVPFDPDGGVKRFINAISGDSEEVSRIQATIRARTESASSLRRISGIVKRARGRVARATQEEQDAEAALRNARKRFGDGSDEVLRAEIRLQRAKRRTIRLTREARLAERLQGVERKVVASRTRDQVVQEKSRIVVLNRSIKTLGRQWQEERRKNGNSKLSRELEQQIIEKMRQREKTQKRLNNVLVDASRQIGPKFAKSLSNISGKAATMEAALGRLPRPTNRVRTALGQLPPVLRKFSASSGEELGAAQKDMERLQGASGLLRRIYNRNIGRSLPDATDTGMGRIQDLLRENIDAIQNTGVPQAKRRGGLVEKVRQRFRKGGVPVAVSPGELFKTPDGRAGIVPGRPEPRDSVLTSMPVGTKIFTWDGQAKLAAGKSEGEALRTQRPHFAGGGIVRPRIEGGTELGAEAANKAVGKVHGAAKARLKWIRENMVTDLDSVTRIAQKYGLQVTSGYRAGDDGYHGVNRARDYSNSSGPTSEMLAFARYLYENHASKLLELIYTPLGAAVKNYTRTGTYAEADHYDHVHVAMRGGGLVKNPWFDKKTKKGNINGIWPSADLTKDPNAWFALPTLPPYVFGALAEAAGRHFGIDVPGRAMMQMVMHEGGTPEGGKPGSRGTDKGGTVGYGPWAITTTYNDELVKRFGGSYAHMNNPVLNAAAMAHIVRDQGLGAWYGDQYVTDPNADWRGKYQLKNALGGIGYSAALRSALSGKFTGSGEGQSAADQRLSRRKAREKRVRELLQKAFGGEGARKGPLWSILDLYANFGDFGKGKNMSEAGYFLRKAGSISALVNPGAGAGQLYQLVKWLQENVDMTGVEKGNTDLASSLKRIRDKQGGKAATKRKRRLSAIGKRGLDYPHKDRLVANDLVIRTAEEWIELAQQSASAESGPGGSEYTATETAYEVRLNESLLKSLQDRKLMLAASIKKVVEKRNQFQAQYLAASKPGSPLAWKRGAFRTGRNNARSTLSGLRSNWEELVGLTGKGGKIGEVKNTLAELGVKSSSSSGPAGIGIGDLLQIVEAAKYGVYDRMPKFHGGGVYKAPVGQSEGPALLKNNETVFTQEQTKALGGPGEFVLVVEDGAVNADRIKLIANGEVRKFDRLKNQQHLAGVGR